MYHGRSAQVAAALVLAGCTTAVAETTPKAAVLQQLLAAALPRGTAAADVVAYLDREKVEHSGFVASERIVNAVYRASERKVVTRSVRVDFHFDVTGHLEAIEAKDVFTGL